MFMLYKNNEKNKKRYWVNEQYFDGSGPVFIMIGGEGEENPIWMNNGQWINFAKQHVITYFFWNLIIIN